ncbi:ribosomal protein S18 acetylase RimI-like enzyme [Jatrophihabitans sp. GAS493]|uniref:GNAT family N-acetyltransferase n=1 Tax=Jatrophihabitans sp. GAS493 TaxID=1907575 RepID=UPI000BB74BC9|nr:GNAT family N-acetyltransferase [Jatrophihabitans sp. GAS493]SOD70993.1 ribosomal protein S18 acetylase RimI-like enzyme [Jatrophihabitans sp. GAS493]
MIEVRVLTADDWRLWRALRRDALRESPGAFGSTLAEWSGRGDTEDRWRARLDDVEFNAVLLLDSVPVGMASGTRPGADGMVELISLWVAPSARGLGVGDAAVAAVLQWVAAGLQWAGAEPAVRLSVKAGNSKAIALYRRHGFVPAGPSPEDPDEILMIRRKVA